jgi:hypothetical protein
MILSAIVAAALVAQQPAAKEPAKPAAVGAAAVVGADQKAGVAKRARKGKSPPERHQEERGIRALLEGKADRAVAPGEILFVGPPPGESTVVALSPERGCAQMIDLLMPSPGNQLYAAFEVKNDQGNIAEGMDSKLEYAYAYVPFKAKAVSTNPYKAQVCVLIPAVVGQAPPNPSRGAVNGLYVHPLYEIPISITCVEAMEGPLKGRRVWTIHANFYTLDKKAADLSYEDRVKLWESLINKPAHTKSRTRQPQKKARPAR